jgi:hypothetical protein
MCVLRNFRYPLSFCRKRGYEGANLGVRPPRVPRYLLANAPKHGRSFGFPRRKGLDSDTLPKPVRTRSVPDSGKSEKPEFPMKNSLQRRMGDLSLTFYWNLEPGPRVGGSTWGRFRTIRLLINEDGGETLGGFWPRGR